MAGELGPVWGAAGVSTEVGRLRAVLMHRPGDELSNVTDPSAMLLSEHIEPELATYQHDMLTAKYKELGIDLIRASLEAWQRSGVPTVGNA
jgi:arginine deiminase